MAELANTGGLFGFGNPTFSRAWYIDGGLDGDSVDISVAPGYVNGYQPYINGSKIGSIPPPRLRDRVVYDKWGRSYISVRVKVDFNTGQIPEKPSQEYLSIEITDIHERARQPLHRGEWYFPIAVIHHKGFIERICYFDLIHWTSFMSGRRDAYPDHFFSVA
jgi:hypothetical protein